MEFNDSASHKGVASWNESLGMNKKNITFLGGNARSSKIETQVQTSNLLSTPVNSASTIYTSDFNFPSRRRTISPNREQMQDKWALFPINVKLSIVQHLRPSLSNYMLVSKSFTSAINAFITKLAIRFKELKDEASCWGHRAPQLFEILENTDAIVIASILQTSFDPHFETDPEKCKDVERILPVLQNYIFKALGVAIENYDRCWATIPHLMKFIYKFRMQYLVYKKTTENLTMSELSSGADVPIASLESLNSQFAAHKIHTQDSKWIEWNEKLIILASRRGHVCNFPSYVELSEAQRVPLFKKALTNCILCSSARGVYSILETSKLWGGEHFWSFLRKAIRAQTEEESFITSARKEENYRVSILLLNYVFNDVNGPYHKRDSSLSEQGLQLLCDAEEMKHTLHITWNWCDRGKKFKVLSSSQALGTLFTSLMSN